MTRLTVLLSLSLAACGGTPESTPPASNGTPHADMNHDDATAHDGDAMPHDGDMKSGKTVYACPMHPDITSDKPGDCSKCGMALVEQKEHDHASHEHGEHHEAGDGH